MQDLFIAPGDRPIYKEGDTVVHPTHGAGIVTGMRTIEWDGEDREYVCIDLRDDNNSTVMVPVEELDDSGLREAIDSLELVREVMFDTPRELHDHYRTRQANIKDRIDKGGPRELIQGLRDLCWREHKDRLTNTDKRLRMKLRKRLQHEIALDHEYTKATIRRKIKKIIREAMEHHADELGVEVE
jgi:CarD family transcriptional regulator